MSARPEHKGYQGTMTLGRPVKASDLRKHIVESCECYSCRVNKEAMEKLYELEFEEMEIPE